MERVNFYVDGFNFYYGLKNQKKQDADWQRFYWLNYVDFFQCFIGEEQQLQKVIYFASPPPHDVQGQRKQTALFTANSFLNPSSFEIVMGQFYRKKVTCKVCKSKYSVYEEKRTDVNIAMRLITDCFHDKVDTLVLVSADSDLVPPLQFINTHFPEKRIRIYFPPGNYSVALENVIKNNKKDVIRLERSKVKFNQSVMPDDVTSADGITVSIPPEWKATNIKTSTI